jgi:SAM-dependent methyltransferase
MSCNETRRVLRALPCRQRVDVEEYIDRPETSVDDIRDTLRDQALVNRWLGGADATLLHVLPLLKTLSADPIRILDAACGGADVSRRIVDAARKLGKRVSITGLDLNEKALDCAREACQDYPEITLTHADALHPPFEPGEFDIVILATFLHHLPPDKVVEALRVAKRLSRTTVIAADLVRSPLAYWGIHVFGRLARFKPISAHDGAVSVCRAYNPRQLVELAHEAGLEPSRIYRHKLCRMTLVYPGMGGAE